MDNIPWHVKIIWNSISVSSNKILLAHSNAYLFTYYLWLPSHSNGRVELLQQKLFAHKAKNVYWLALIQFAGPWSRVIDSLSKKHSCWIWRQGSHWCFSWQFHCQGADLLNDSLVSCSLLHKERGLIFKEMGKASCYIEISDLFLSREHPIELCLTWSSTNGKKKYSLVK